MVPLLAPRKPRKLRPTSHLARSRRLLPASSLTNTNKLPHSPLVFFSRCWQVCSAYVRHSFLTTSCHSPIRLHFQNFISLFVQIAQFEREDSEGLQKWLHFCGLSDVFSKLSIWQQLPKHWKNGAHLREWHKAASARTPHIISSWRKTSKLNWMICTHTGRAESGSRPPKPDGEGSGSKPPGLGVSEPAKVSWPGGKQAKASLAMALLQTLMGHVGSCNSTSSSCKYELPSAQILIMWLQGHCNGCNFGNRL